MSEEQIKHFAVGKHAVKPDNAPAHHVVFDYENALIEPSASEPTRLATVRFQIPEGPSYEGVHTGINDVDSLDFDAPAEPAAESLSDILTEFSSMSSVDEVGQPKRNENRVKDNRASFKVKKYGSSVSLIQRFSEWFSASLINKIITSGVVIILTCGIVALCIALPGKKAEKSSDDTPFVDVDDSDEKEGEIKTEDSKFKGEDKYKGVLLTKTTDAGDDYINNTLFIGDSNTARINLYGLLGLKNVIGIESMGIQAVPAQQCVYFTDRENPVTIPEAVKLIQPMRIVICFGTNNLAALKPVEFIESYKKALYSLRKAYSYADIIIAAVPPLGANYTGNIDINQNKVDKFNDALIDLAKEEKLTFLDITEALADKNGYIKEDYVISDGIHVSKTGFQALGRYFRTHSHITKDIRPTPLNEIPTRRPAPAKEVETLDTDKIIDVAMNCFFEDEFSLPGEDTDLNSGTKLTFSIPNDTKQGDEESWGKSLYQSLLARTTVQKGYISISCKEDTETKEFVFTARIVANMETCVHEFDEIKTVPSEFPCCGGYTIRTCKICGYEDKKQDIAPTTEHVPDDNSYNPTSVPTCTDTDQTWVCKVCHQKQTTHIAATTDHQVGSWTISKQPTCTEPGVQDGVCQLCGKTVNAVINALGHEWGDWSETIQEATDSHPKQIVRSRSCLRCGIKDEIITPITVENP